MAHGSSLVGDVVAPRSKFYQGPFGRICSDLDPWTPPLSAEPTEAAITAHFLRIANEEMIEVPGKKAQDIVENDPDIAAMSAKIPVGYTYFGQFVDHDITFDPASSLMRQNDPEGLLNHRTPRLDLDNVYGRGPDESPYLYDRADPAKFLIGEIAGTKFPDLPRNSQGRALIGDARNDENAIVSQLHLCFLRAHNTLVDRASAAGAGSASFEQARKTLRWLYQYIVWNDFIRRITIDSIFNAGLIKEAVPGGRTHWKLGMQDVYKWRNQPFMPVEFSVAAYRFGHSVVRNGYQTNAPARGFQNFVPIFNLGGTPVDPSDPAAGPDDLRGFRPMKIENAIQWDWFLQMASSAPGLFPQTARKIDTKLANALSQMHEAPDGSSMNILAFRNLLRGWRFGLPSGTSVARKYCLEPIAIDPKQDSLWFYILKEADSLPGANRGEMLGAVGSTIVCAVFAGLLKGDPSSYLNVAPCWTPDDDPLLTADDKRDDATDWTLASIIRIAGMPADGNDFQGMMDNGQIPDPPPPPQATA